MAPWNKVGPLSKAQKEGDALKKTVDQIIKESNKVISQKAVGNKAAEKQQKLEQMFQNCIDSKSLVVQHLAEVESLQEKNEPSKMKDFEKKKTAEVTRTTGLKKLLEDTMVKLLPTTDEKEFIRSHQSVDEKEKDDKEEATTKGKKQDKAEDEEEEDDEDEEEEDDEDDEEEEDDDEDDNDIETDAVKERPIAKPPAAKLVQKEESEDEEDEEEDEEDEEEESEEETEMQKPNIKSAAHQTKAEEGEEEDDDEDEEEDDEDEDDEEEDEDDEDEVTEEKSEKTDALKTERSSQQLRQFITLDEYKGEVDGDLSFQEGEILVVLDTSRDDGWWKARNKNGQVGMVPSTFLQEHTEKSEDEVDHGVVTRTRRGKKLWKGLKQALNETTVSDVLHAMGAVPSGFRLSTLCRKFNEGDAYRIINYLFPKLSHSNLSYRDLVFDPASNKIHLRAVRIDRVVSLVSCQQIPPPGAGIEVLDRHVRMCLFDGQHIISNIHAIKVASVNRDQRTWGFSIKVSDMMDPGMYSEFFVRSNFNADNIGILFELGISYLRVSTQERGEFSCGWAHLPLLEETGNVVTNKTFDLQLHGGTPYEKDVEVDPSISRRATNNTLMALISGNKQPRLLLKVSEPKKQQKDLMDVLPDTIVGSTCLLQQYAYYRQCLADVLLRDRIDLNSTELIHNPFLATFPSCADCPDMMGTLRTAWLEKLQELKRIEKRDEEFMKQMFRQVFMETVYSISSLATLPDFIMGDVEILKLRQEQISKFLEKKRYAKTALAALLSEDFMFDPFDLKETAFNVIESYCLTKQQVATEN
ncbi:Nephrocystin-1 [Bulinus truncatus]|nr:Nephrocystin-1 [Bulinus truncatus]